MAESVMDRLREAVARHKEWPTSQTRSQVCDAAIALIGAIELRAAYIEHMMATVTPTEQAIADILGKDNQL